MDQPQDKPLFSWGSVDVTLIDKASRRICVVVHVYVWEHELETEDTKKKVKLSVDKALGYMAAEGFIPTHKGWHVEIAIVGHTPKE